MKNLILCNHSIHIILLFLRHIFFGYKFPIGTNKISKQNIRRKMYLLVPISDELHYAEHPLRLLMQWTI